MRRRRTGDGPAELQSRSETAGENGDDDDVTTWFALSAITSANNRRANREKERTLSKRKSVPDSCYSPAGEAIAWKALRVEGRTRASELSRGLFCWWPMMASMEKELFHDLRGWSSAMRTTPAADRLGAEVADLLFVVS